MRHTPRSLIANEGYEVAWTRPRPFFNQPLPPLSDGTTAPLPGGNPTNQFPWVSRGYAIVIPQNVNPNVPLLLEDNYRNLLILQNNSTFTTAGDTAPNLFIALDGPVQFVTPVATSFAYNAITLVPGEGLLLDTRILGNALYFAWGSFSNPHNTTGVFGMCIYGRTLNSPPLPPQLALPQLMAGPTTRGVYGERVSVGLKGGA